MPITISRHLSAAPAGGSRAQFMADDNGEEFVVKFKENGQNLRVLANEYIAGKISKELNLTSPDVEIVELSPLLAPAVSASFGTPVSVGPHFGSKLMKNSYSLPGRHLIGQCVNSDQYPSVILFDVLLQNSDRNNDGNYLILTDPNGYQLCIIDHGHCFHNTWDANTLPTLVGQWSSSGLPEMYNTITAASNMDLAIQNIEGLTDAFFTNLVDEVPMDWLPLDAERTAMVNYLKGQRNSIRALVTANKNRFTNWI